MNASAGTARAGSSSNRSVESDGAGKRKPRSRLACSGCKSTKQKCDGPTPGKSACRRCITYGLVCTFPAASNGVLYSVPPLPAASTVGSSGSSDGMADILIKINARLQSIEDALKGDQLDYDSDSRQVKRRRMDGGAKDEEEADEEDDEDDQKEAPRVVNNPLLEVTESIERIVGYVGYADVESKGSSSADVVSRGFLSMDDAQALFDFFFDKVQPWVGSMSQILDSNAAIVRQRDQLLFHVILLLSSSYGAPSSVHSALNSSFLELYGASILSPQAFTTDFVKSLDLLNLYKPIVHRSTGKAEANVKSKVNGLASFLCHVMLSRVAERLDLSDSVEAFHRSHQLMQEMGIPIEEQVISDLRIYLRLRSDDVLGHVQSGRRCNMSMDAPNPFVLQLFATCNYQPFDLRLAAMAVMYDNCRPILLSKAYERTRKIARADLEQLNASMREWELQYEPLLLAALPVDPLAMSVVSPFSLFITLSFNASAYTTWTRGNTLTAWEYECIEKSVRAAESIIFSLSQESRIGSSKLGRRELRWGEAARAAGAGHRRLVLDESISASHRFGADTITCVSYIFPLIFLTKLINDGILTSDLEVLSTPVVQPPFLPTAKLPRLLELGAAFLDAISPSVDHPATQQATLLRSLLEHGIGHSLARPSSSTQPELRPTISPSFALPQHSDVSSSGNRTPALDFALNKLVDLSEFGEFSFWENANVGGMEMSESLGSTHWSYKL